MIKGWLVSINIVLFLSDLIRSNKLSDSKHDLDIKPTGK